METLTQPIPLPTQSADVPSLEEKVRKMIDEDLVVSTFDAIFVDKRVIVFPCFVLVSFRTITWLISFKNCLFLSNRGRNTFSFKLFLSERVTVKTKKVQSKISVYKILKNKQLQLKTIFSSLHLNRYAVGFIHILQLEMH